ncbi:UDP-N-acetylglucosamine 2-epimerase (non-hydrolyzing) [Patescibacteria group bacterium]|nr:UDP-N-acetylglucosamine 2-epimerase (non-hydrolyzing) [Patescibacteria group bacterium]
MPQNIKILIVAGARPNFIKIAPLIEEFKKHRNIKTVLVHTGQHYDFEMSKVFFQELKIPKPNYNLGVGSGTHAYQIGEIMIRFEKVILKEKPDLVIVVGDVNSTLAGALTAVKLHIPVAHVEAGLRSFDLKMPEEVNRLLTDQISDYLFVTEPSAIKNLLREGLERKKIFFVGNIMIDTLLRYKNIFLKRKTLQKFGFRRRQYALLTLHRPKNVDYKEVFRGILEALTEIQKRIKIIYPIHPRTKKRIKEFGFKDKIKRMKNLILVKPVGYLNMLNLMGNAKLVLTDSGGIQEETTVLSIPCLTIRKVTERPITCEIGTNKVIGLQKENIIKESLKILNGKTKKGKIPKYWDGKTAKRIVNIIRKKYEG